MQHLMQAARLVLTTAFLVLGAHQGLAQSDPLPSWNDGAAKKSILDFVARTTTQGGADFVPVDRRIATFDNDGTLWSEQPVYFQIAFAFDRIKALAPQHPEWKTKEPFKTILSGDRAALAVRAIVLADRAELTVDEFPQIAAHVEGFHAEIPDAPASVHGRPAYTGPALLGAEATIPRTVEVGATAGRSSLGIPAVDEKGEIRTLEAMEAT